LLSHLLGCFVGSGCFIALLWRFFSSRRKKITIYITLLPFFLPSNSHVLKNAFLTHPTTQWHVGSARFFWHGLPPGTGSWRMPFSTTRPFSARTRPRRASAAALCASASPSGSSRSTCSSSRSRKSESRRRSSGNSRSSSDECHLDDDVGAWKKKICQKKKLKKNNESNRNTLKLDFFIVKIGSLSLADCTLL
jgi:hypothetical protein